MNILVKSIFGAHLYGTATENSDTDYRGVFMPIPRDVYFGKVPRTWSETTGPKHAKNASTDIDTEFYSLHYFIELALAGETVALDLLHSPESAWVEHSPIWEDLITHRHWFYSKNLTAFVGYARRQAAKYGIKGSRLSAAKRALEFLESHGEKRLRDVWNETWEDEYCKHMDGEKERIWQVCGRGLGESAHCDYLADGIRVFVQRYGDRARQAEQNEGIDWKAISHAFRAGYQAKAILTKGGFTFPLPEAPFLKEVKLGKLDYLTEAAPQLEALMDEVEQARTLSLLPDKADRKAAEAWLITQVRIWCGLNHEVSP